jgi:hypothetical protein
LGEELSLFGAEFNGSLRVETRPERLTGDAGCVLLREVIERLGISKWLTKRLSDPRKAALVTHPQSELLNTSILLLAQGWRDQVLPRSLVAGRVTGLADGHHGAGASGAVA